MDIAYCWSSHNPQHGPLANNNPVHLHISSVKFLVRKNYILIVYFPFVLFLTFFDINILFKVAPVETNIAPLVVWVILGKLLKIYLSTNQSTNQPINQSINQSSIRRIISFTYLVQHTGIIQDCLGFNQQNQLWNVPYLVRGCMGHAKGNLTITP